MAEPSKKSDAMEAALIQLFGYDRRKFIRNDLCVSCYGAALHFDDELSQQEYTISGLCQDCQNGTFGKSNS